MGVKSSQEQRCDAVWPDPQRLGRLFVITKGFGMRSGTHEILGTLRADGGSNM
jgi:hypothetical protein